MNDESSHRGIELLRKFAHVAVAFSFALIAQWLTSYELAVCGLVLFAVFLLVRLMKWSVIFHAVLRVTYGDLFFALSIAVAAMLVFPLSLEAFRFGMLTMGLAETAAAIVGITLGSYQFRVWGERKTLEGSLAFFVVAALLSVLFGFSHAYAAYIGLALAVVELVAPRGSDNFFIPLAAGWLHIYFLL